MLHQRLLNQAIPLGRWRPGASLPQLGPSSTPQAKSHTPCITLSSSNGNSSSNSTSTISYCGSFSSPSLGRLLILLLKQHEAAHSSGGPRGAQGALRASLLRTMRPYSKAVDEEELLETGAPAYAAKFGSSSQRALVVHAVFPAPRRQGSTFLPKTREVYPTP